MSEAQPVNCTCIDCSIRRQAANIEALRECIRIRTEERDALTVRTENQSRDILRLHKQTDVLARRNHALSDEVEALETDLLTARLEMETKP
jgi:cell division protein FtsB